MLSYCKYQPGDGANGLSVLILSFGVMMWCALWLLNVCQCLELSSIVHSSAALPMQVQRYTVDARKTFHAIPVVTAGVACLLIKQPGGAS